MDNNSKTAFLSLAKLGAAISFALSARALDEACEHNMSKLLKAMADGHKPLLPRQ